MAAFLKAIGEAEGGGYDFKYGAVKGKRNDPWRFTDTSTHPGPGFGGKTTAAGMYQITIDTWRDHGGKMGLTDFTPTTQDLIAVEMLRSLGVIDNIEAGDIAGAMPQAAKIGRLSRWGRAWRIAIHRSPTWITTHFWQHTRPPGDQQNEDLHRTASFRRRCLAAVPLSARWGRPCRQACDCAHESTLARRRIVCTCPFLSHQIRMEACSDACGR